MEYPVEFYEVLTPDSEEAKQARERFQKWMDSIKGTHLGDYVESLMNTPWEIDPPDPA